MAKRNKTENPLSSLEKITNASSFISDSKVAKAIAAYTVMDTWIDDIKPTVSSVKSYFTHTISIDSTDALYEEVESWVLSYLDEKLVKKTRVKASGALSTALIEIQPYRVNKPVRFKINGHRVKAVIAFTQGNGKDKPDKELITFYTFHKEAYDGLVEKFNTLKAETRKKVNPPKLYRPTSWGGFSCSGAVPPRSLNSVILKDGELEYLINDLEHFLNSEDRYNELGLPWHRGYLFYGMAGTGKTSIAKAISAHFGLDVYSLSIGDINDDNTLSGYLSYLKPRSVMLLEDIDVFSAATSREAEDNNVSLAGLLNVLDGIATPHGLIKILTTNHVEKLDEALIRPGRVDVKKEFTYLDQKQGERLWEHFYKVPAPASLSFSGLSPATLVGVMKQCMDNPEEAKLYFESNIVNLVEDTL